MLAWVQSSIKAEVVFRIKKFFAYYPEYIPMCIRSITVQRVPIFYVWNHACMVLTALISGCNHCNKQRTLHVFSSVKGKGIIGSYLTDVIDQISNNQLKKAWHIAVYIGGFLRVLATY